MAGSSDADVSPMISIEVARGRTNTYESFGGAVESYSYDSDILSLGDPFALGIINPEGVFSSGGNSLGQRQQRIAIGDKVRLYIEDKKYHDGDKVLLLTGIATDIDVSSSNHAGTKMHICGADLGWHLTNNTGPYHFSYKSGKLGPVLKASLHPSWGLYYDEENKALVRRGRTTRAQAQRVIAGGSTTSTPVVVVQFEPGQTIADVLVELSKRLGLLVNVSPQGEIRFFKPQYYQTPSYSIFYYGSNNKRRILNNVLSADLKTSINGVYTSVRCAWQTAFPPAVLNNNTENPNAGKSSFTVTAEHALPFERRTSFSEGDVLNQEFAENRAKWKLQRGQFDSWTASYTMIGHTQTTTEGVVSFYEPDTMVAIDDDVLNIHGNFYVSAARYNRTPQQGTTTQLTIKKPHQLGA